MYFFFAPLSFRVSSSQDRISSVPLSQGGRSARNTSVTIPRRYRPTFISSNITIAPNALQFPLHRHGNRSGVGGRVKNDGVPPSAPLRVLLRAPPSTRSLARPCPPSRAGENRMAR